MRQITSTRAKQAFGELLEAAAHEPVAIGKHRKVRAILAAPEFFAVASRDEAKAPQRQLARSLHLLREKDRLIRHQRIAITLLTLPANERKALVNRARKEVTRWREDRLCSADYIERWHALLNQPIKELALALTGDLDGWGNALRQNSPFSRENV